MTRNITTHGFFLALHSSVSWRSAD